MGEREWDYYIPRRLCTTRYTEEPPSVSSIWPRLHLVVKEETQVIADAA
jgi:hypothetical protein